MKKVVFRYKEEPIFGGRPRHSIKFIVGEEEKVDVDIVKNDGTLEHGFRFDHIMGISCEFSKVAPIEDVIEKLESIVKDLKQCQK